MVGRVADGYSYIWGLWTQKCWGCKGIYLDGPQNLAKSRPISEVGKVRHGKTGYSRRVISPKLEVVAGKTIELHMFSSILETECHFGVSMLRMFQNSMDDGFRRYFPFSGHPGSWYFSDSKRPSGWRVEPLVKIDGQLALYKWPACISQQRVWRSLGQLGLPTGKDQEPSQSRRFKTMVAKIHRVRLQFSLRKTPIGCTLPFQLWHSMKNWDPNWDPPSIHPFFSVLSKGPIICSPRAASQITKNIRKPGHKRVAAT